MIRLMEMVATFMQRVLSIKEDGSKINKKARVDRNGPMEVSTSVST